MTESRNAPARFGWPQAFALIGTLGVVGAALVAFFFLRSAGQLGETVLEGGRNALAELEEIARAFNKGTITTTFVSYATEVSDSNYLQFATLNEREIFERTDTATTLWGRLELPAVVVQATADVEYTYYLNLDGSWSFELEGDEIRVLAPAIEFNRPSIDASSLRYEVRKDSLLRDEEEAVAQLQRGLSTMAEGRARDNIPLIREIGRRKTEEFVANWLLRDFGKEAKGYHVEVLFADEQSSPQGLLQIERSTRD